MSLAIYCKSIALTRSKGLGRKRNNYNSRSYEAVCYGQGNRASSPNKLNWLRMVVDVMAVVMVVAVQMW